jgi:ADP-dependent NAD(P)H-hydrate dehydratase / NAD(P)H-hydrate epimerase
MEETSPEILRNIYKPRPAEAKKYDFGLLLIIGGSDFYSGSPALSALAAFRAGVDMVRIVAPRRAADIISSFSANLAAYPLEGKWLTKEHLAFLFSMTEAAEAAARGNTAVVIGGGIGRMEETQETIREYLSQIHIPAVIDADAIYAIAGGKEITKKKNFLITPHTHEFSVLTGKDVKNISREDRIKVVQEEANRFGSTIILKGETDIISDGRRVAIDKIGSPYMTVGGCGDSLAGICGALLARKVEVFEAAKAAAFINGAAGEIAAEKLGEGMMATDLIEAIPEVLR